MKCSRSSCAGRAVWLLCAAVWLCVPSMARQQSQQTSQQQPSSQQQPGAAQDDEVLRVSTSLVQTDVTVVDKQGRFVPGLRPEEFELKVDGKAQPLIFFEQVKAGGVDEARRIASARGEAAPAAPVSVAALGRSVIFFVDDLHLSPSGLQRTRQVLNKIIDDELTPDTQAIVVSPSGRIGFLQQFTHEKAVLRAALARLTSPDPRGTRDAEQPPMSFYQAVQIDRGERDLLEFFIQQTIYQSRPNVLPRALAEIQVTNRARRIRRQAALLSAGVLGALEQAALAPAPTRGRRLLYFLSEGFVTDPSEGDSFYRFRRVVDAAARTGTVIYTLDTRGLTVGMHDASTDINADINEPSSGTGQTYGSGASPTLEISATQDVLRSLAADTGGRALLNTNALEAALAKTLEETANYYLLAWRPEGVATDEKGAPRFRKVEVGVRNRPDVRVRVRRGIFGGRPTTDARAGATANARPEATANATAPDPTKPAASVLNTELNSTAPNRSLPVSLYAVPVDTDGNAAGGLTLTAFMQVDGRGLEYTTDASGRKVAEVETAYVVLDDRGKPVHSAGRRLTLDGTNASGSPASSRVALLTNFTAPALAPGLYQVRVAARDQRSGFVGGARQWVEVPDLKTRRLTLGGLVLAESRAATAGNAPAVAQDAASIRPSASRVFSRASKMLVELHIYNASSSASGPDLEMSLRVLSGDKQALAAPPHKVSTAGNADPANIRYAAEIPLRSLAPGAYLLEVAVTDRASRTTAKRQLAFAVE